MRSGDGNSRNIQGSSKGTVRKEIVGVRDLIGIRIVKLAMNVRKLGMIEDSEAETNDTSPFAFGSGFDRRICHITLGGFRELRMCWKQFDRHS